MKPRTTLILLALVLLAGLVAYALSRRPAAEQSPAASTALLPGLRADAVNSLLIERAGQRILCERQDGRWRLAEPLQARADADRISAIIAGFQSARTAASISVPDPAATAPYGLRTPNCTVTMGAPDRTWTVRFGAPMPVGNLTYAAVDGRADVFAVSTDLLRGLGLTVADLRSKRLAPPLDPAGLQALAVSAAPLDGAPGFALECRRLGERWELTAPVADLADAALVAQLVDRISAYRAAAGDFVAGSPPDYGLDSPGLTVTLTAAEGAQTLLLSRRPEGCYALLRGESATVRVPEELFDALRRPPDELRDRALAHVAAGDVAAVELAGPQGTLALAREQGSWQIAGAAPAPADDAVVAGLLDAIAAARAEGFPADAPGDLAAWGLAPDERTMVTLRGADGGSLAAFALGRQPATGDIVAMRPPHRGVLLLGRDAGLAGLFAGRLGFLERTVLQEPASDAVQIDLQNAAGVFRVAWDGTAGAWRLAAPVDGPADGRAVDAVLGDFANLRAEGFAAEAAADVAAFGLDRPQATAAVTYRPAGAAAPVVHTLRIGGAARGETGGCYAALDVDGRVFVLADTVARHFRGDLASKVICRAQELTGLVVRAGGRSAGFRYDAPFNTWTDAAGAALPAPVTAALSDAAALLRDFRGRAVADYVEKAPALYGFDAPYLEVELSEPATAGKRILIGKEAEGGGRYARGPVTDFVLIADDADVARLRAVLGPQ